MKKLKSSLFRGQGAIQKLASQSDGMNSTVPYDHYTPIWVEGKIVGGVMGHEFVKWVQARIHFLYRPPAIAFDYQSLIEAGQAGARTVKVIDTETGDVFRALISTIWSNGFELDRGHGRQWALPMSYWTRGNNPLNEQLQLWGAK